MGFDQVYSGKVFVAGDTVHVSSELLLEPNCGAIVGYAWQAGKKLLWHSPPEFAETYSRFATISRMDENALQRKVVALFGQAYQMHAQDIHIIHTGTATRILFRVLGDMLPYALWDAETGEQTMALLYNYFAQETGSSVFTPYERLDGRIVNPRVLPGSVRAIRLHSEPIQSQSDKPSCFMTLRLLYDATSAKGSLGERIAQLGMTSYQQGLILGLAQSQGLIVISGATGHGKSTVLKHVFEGMVKAMPEKAYVSVEDPPEFVIEGVRQIQVDSSEGASHLRQERYRDALAGALRSDPDVLMIGEIRYPEACELALSAAQTGHAVWATLHANDSFGIVQRMEGLLAARGERQARQRLCDPLILSGLIHQRLVPVLCEQCKEPLLTHPLDAKTMARFAKTFPDLASLCVRGKGCAMCHGQGVSAMTLCAEVVPVDSALCAAMLHDIQDVRTQWHKQYGTCLDVALSKAVKGILDPRDIEKRFGLSLENIKYDSSKIF